MHNTCLRPWAFKDKTIEILFQKHIVETVIVRTRSKLTMIINFSWVIRVIVLVLRAVSPYDWTTREAIVSIFRIFLMLIGNMVLSFEWSSSTKVWLSRKLLWLVRLGFFPAFAEQAGVNQHDSMFMYYPIIFILVAGIALPSFEEFFGFCLAVFLVKPVAIIGFGSGGCPAGIPPPCPGRDLQTVLIQNSCFALMAIGVFYHVFSDIRRSWLLSFEMFGPLNRSIPVSASIPLPDPGASGPPPIDGDPAQKAAAAASPADPPADEDDGGEERGSLERDHYFPADQRAEQMDLWRREAAEIRARAGAARAAPPPRLTLAPGGGGRGARVHRALDADTGERLAVKFLPGGPAHARFLRREVRRARALAHPNLAAVRGGGGGSESIGGGWGARLRVVSEYCGGGR